MLFIICESVMFIHCHFVCVYSLGAQIEKTTNKEACRDLSGRRLRDINKEKLLKDQIQKRAERERERLANRKKKFEALKQEPKHIFNDSSFYKEQEEITQALFDSVDKGLKVAAAEKNGPKKRDPTASTSDEDQSQQKLSETNSKTSTSDKDQLGECSSSNINPTKQGTDKASSNSIASKDMLESGPSSSGCSSGAESSEQDPKLSQSKAVKRTQPSQPATKKLPAKKRRFFDDLDESSDDSD